MKIERVPSDALAEAKLADGSIAIFNAETKTVFSLNATAGAAWEACSQAATLSEIMESMRTSLGHAVTEDLALDALKELRKQGLLKTEVLPRQATRRSLVRTAAMVAPVVLALSAAEQHAAALISYSGATTTTSTTTTSTTRRPTSTTAAPTSTTGAPPPTPAPTTTMD